jgi:hypothetical protein
MNSDDEKTSVVPGTDAKQLAIEVAAFAASAIPYLGGPIAQVLSGVGTVRRINRVREVVDALAADLAGFKSDATEKYVRSEEFEELLERTLRQAADERSDEKRRVYAAFLADDIKVPGASYDEKIRFLRTLEELQPDHLSLLKALSAKPEANPGSIGAPSQTLAKRLPEMNAAHISELVAQLNAMRVTSLQSLQVTMTGHGAADLRHSVTDYGQRFLKFLK